jgi:hypothetical protein
VEIDRIFDRDPDRVVRQLVVAQRLLSCAIA